MIFLSFMMRPPFLSIRFCRSGQPDKRDMPDIIGHIGRIGWICIDGIFHDDVKHVPERKAFHVVPLGQTVIGHLVKVPQHHAVDVHDPDQNIRRQIQTGIAVFQFHEKLRRRAFPLLLLFCEVPNQLQHPVMDCGVGLYAAEILQGLKETDNEIEAVCYIPYEEQATKWTPELRNRYFDALTSCTEVVDVSYEKTVGCEFKSHFEVMKNADTLIIVYDPTDPICERETAIVAVVKEWNKQVLAIDPKSIHLF